MHSFLQNYMLFFNQYFEFSRTENLLDFVCSSIKFYLLLSPYLCFISLLYLDLYVFGDDALIS